MEGSGARRDKAPRRSTAFGARLRGLREEAGLTQEELAARAGLTAHAVGVLERGERKRPYPHTVRSLADALGLSEGERASLLAAVPRRGEATAAATASTPAAVPGAPLPVPPTPLVGRENELRETVGILLRPEARLLTLTGTGGVGKTRLSLEAARASLAAGSFPDGVYFVSLASVVDPSLVVVAVCEALGVGETEGQTLYEGLRAYLRDKRSLLVLDNLEQVLEAATEIAGLLGACPGLVVLATSRAPLRVRGEQEYPVPPLGLPSSIRASRREEVLGSASGRLFVDRARASAPSFAVTEDNASAVAAICWRLAGLPLALELGAASARFLDPATLLSRLDRALSSGWTRDLPPRQRTMRAALDWSHDLLAEDERGLFRGLSVFAGGFSLEAAEAVGVPEEVDPDESIGLLGRLVEQSLVTAEAGGAGETRYGMLEPIRQYALEKLGESDEAAEKGRRHAGYYLTLAERFEPKLRGRDQALWLGRLQAERDNLRAAMSWALERGEAQIVARMAWAMLPLWWLQGHFAEGRRLTEEALPHATDLPAPARAKLLFAAGTMAQAQADYGAAGPLIEESLALFRNLGDEEGVMRAQSSAGIVALGQGQQERGIALLEEATALALKIGDVWSASLLLGFATAVPLGRGDLARARELAERGLSLAREAGAREGASVALHALATVARTEGDEDRAERLFGEGLGLSVEVGDETTVAHFLEGLAAVAASKDQPARAARLWGAAEALLETIEVAAYPHAPDRSLRRREVAAARARLGTDEWGEAWAEGRGMSAERAAAYALAGT